MKESTICTSGDYLIVRNCGGLYQIPLSRVILIKKNLRQTVIVTDGENLDKQIVCYCALRDVYHKLEDSKFLYEHQSYIINADHIAHLDKGQVVTDDGSVIYLGRNSYYRLLKAFKSLRNEGLNGRKNDTKNEEKNNKKKE
ncbi:MAG: LytTR family transcriptional regulator [Clostridiales bacterium]|nr:LytTR family transcriptional regulator [Clostridiales bacterium]MDD7035421.1 LytTR family DNA-binding domain-containing protein [Bacillota bacterium]MDY2920003.1 LytTR family DNA-binding domain-containing protein [Lentihominibacter sp.]